MRTEKIEVTMGGTEFLDMHRSRKYKGRRVARYAVLAEQTDAMTLDDKRRVRLDIEVVEPSTSEVIMISPTAANEIFLELIKMRNQFEESAKKITSLLDKS